MQEVAWWWSWLLMAFGVTGLYLVGKRKWWAWLISFTGEVLWIAYAIVTKQYGFIIFALTYMVVYLKNAREWKRQEWFVSTQT
jgi:uncharacterized membrane protein